jgi:hypothetical protein
MNSETPKWLWARVAPLVALASAIGLVFIFMKTPKAQPTLSLPFATVVSVTSSSAQLIGVNPSRRSIQICLPAVAGTVTIAPAPITPVSLTLGISMTSTATITGPLCFTPPANVLSGGSAGGAGNAWNAIASTTMNVTVLEW